MDYEKKYLKYKMKYEELKKLSHDQEGGRSWSFGKKLSPEEQAASDAKKLLKKHNELLEKQLNKQLSDLRKKVSSMTRGLNKKQENQIMMAYQNVFGERKWGRGRDGSFRIAIEQNTDRTKQLKEILLEKLHNTELSIIVEKMIQEAIDQLWKEVAEQVPNIAVHYHKKTAENIAIMIEQINLNNKCESENIKTGYPECTKEKIEDKQSRLDDFKKEVNSYYNQMDKLNKDLNLLESNFNKINQPDQKDLKLLDSNFKKINQPNKNNRQKAEERFEELNKKFLGPSTSTKKEAEDKFKELRTQLNKDLMLLLCRNFESNVSESDCNEIFIYQSLYNKYKRPNDTNNSDFVKILNDVLGKIPEGLKLDNEPVQSNIPRSSPHNQPVRRQSYTPRASPRARSNQPRRAGTYF